MKLLLSSVATFLAGLASLARAGPPSTVDLRSEYVIDSWQTEQGLPDNFITSIAQSADGYIWIGTFNGLTRFNGSDFVTFDAGNTPALASSRIAQLHPDREGRLWIVEESGAVVSWFHGRFKPWLSAGGPPVTAQWWREDQAGNVWVATPEHGTNYFRVAGERLEQIQTAETFYERFGSATDTHGVSWGVWSNCLCSIGENNPVRAPIPGYNGAGWRLLPSRDGGLWFIANRIQKFLRGRWLDFGPEPLRGETFNGYTEDQTGALWVGTDFGELWRVGTNGVLCRFTLNGASNPQLGRGLLVDAEGNLWIGTGGSGLYRLKPQTFRNYDSHHGLASDLVRSVTQDGAGNIWIASINRVDWIPVGQNEVQRSLSPAILPWEVFGAKDEGIWIGTFGEGLFRLHSPNGPSVQYATKLDGRMPTINAIFLRKNGELDLGTPRGLAVWKDGVLSKGSQPPSPDSLDVRAIAEDQDGFWLGMESQGLFCHNSRGWIHLTSKDGLGSDQIPALLADDANNLWIGAHGGGLSLFRKGRLSHFATAPSGIPRVITSIIDDDLGCLWLASNQGLYRVKKEQLYALAGGAALLPDVFHYDRADGMGSGQCTGDHQPAACKGQDGRLWFATMSGLTVVDPARLPFNPRPPPVVIEGVSADDKPLPMDASHSGPIQIPAGSTRLEFRFAALTYVSPEKARFRYQLEGFDHAWTASGNRRMADYTRPAPGFYRFHVIAANNDNVWNDEGAIINVHVLPLYWQTAWFRAAAVLVLIGVAAWLYHRRVERLHQQRVLQETFSRRLIQSQESERKRMAAELHDSLGQGLLVVNNHAVMALKEAGTSDKLRERLRKISEGATSCIEEVRVIARSLRPYQLDRFGLTKTLEDVAHLLAHTGGLEVSAEIDNIDGLFSSEVDISLYRVAQEWLNNVAKHANATRARLVVRRQADGVRFILEDNGVGFDYGAVMAGSAQNNFGLMNLRERVRLLGGVFELETARGRGARWIVAIPYEGNRFDPDRR